MSIRNSLVLGLVAGAALLAQGTDPGTDPRGAFKVNLPGDSPLGLVSADWGSSRASARGGAVLVDLHSTLVLRNNSGRTVRGVCFLVLAQEVTPGGKASVTVPGLDVQPGENFPIRIDLRLMRPLATGSGALVEVGLDGVLYQDLGFYGPNRLNAKRTMLTWELEARRDRKALLATLEAGGPEALRKQLLAALSRQAEMPRMDMQVAKALPATNVEPGKDIQFAFLQLPDAPVELLSGAAELAGNEARRPHINVQNKSKRPIRYLELSWLVKDAGGREFLAGSLPADVALAPGQHSTIKKDNTLRFARPVSGLTAYPSSVEYADGEIWVPSSSALREPRLAVALPATGEEQRLSELYRRKGLDAVVQQLRSLR